MEFQIQNLFDYIVIGIVFISLLLGFFKGFIGTSLSLIRFILSISVAISYSDYAIPVVSKYVSNPDIASYLAFLVTFIVVFIIFSIFKYYITAMLDNVDKGSVDKLLGLCFGLIRGVAIVCFIYLSIAGITGSIKNDIYKDHDFAIEKAKMPVWVQSSGLKVGIEEFSHIFIGILPDSWLEKFNNMFHVKEMTISTSSKDSSQKLASSDRSIGERILKQFPENYKKIEPLLRQLNRSTEDEKLHIISEIHNLYMNTISKDVSYNDHKKVLEYFDYLEKEKNNLKNKAND